MKDRWDDGTGVLVPAGPRPLRDGAHAQPPELERERQHAQRR
ncbi:hypothetical protein [Deinococcus arenicola]|uniref:Uncharacterized protein n=1 Tax=Deinococcus arenicola TaxID=2994950 RepID=A0ABU4DQA4_9DEIO|nr:hypothetical protein [Deinococcus sp. ZS9-10]MDV6374613.1 hypothetical protein [Deinococcus sp. ZS9-10]